MTEIEIIKQRLDEIYGRICELVDDYLKEENKDDREQGK